MSDSSTNNPSGRLQRLQHLEHSGASINSSITSLTKSIIGAGMLAMPFAYRADGILLGTLIIIFAGLSAGFGFYIQFKSSQFVSPGNATFFAVCSITYPKLTLIFDLAVFLQCFGTVVSYLVIVGDLLPHLINTTRTTSILSTLIIIAPLSFLHNIDSLKYTSVIALFAILYMTMLVIYHFLTRDSIPADLIGPISFIQPLSISSVFSTFSIIVFAFTGHQNMYSIINESKSKSEKVIVKIISSAILISSTFFIIVGICGYLTFGSKVTGNVVLMYDHNLLPNYLGRIAIVVMVVLSFPLMFHPCRLSSNNILYYFTAKHGQKLQEDEQEDVSQEEESTALLETSNVPKNVVVPFSTRKFILITTVLLSVCYILAISVSSFALVLSLVGATGSTSISFVLPGLFGYKLLGKNEFSNSHKSDTVVKYLSLSLTIWGLFVMIVCVGFILKGD